MTGDVDTTESVEKEVDLKEIDSSSISKVVEMVKDEAIAGYLKEVTDIISEAIPCSSLTSKAVEAKKEKVPIDKRIVGLVLNRKDLSALIGDTLFERSQFLSQI